MKILVVDYYLYSICNCKLNLVNSISVMAKNETYTMQTNILIFLNNIKTEKK